MNLPDPYRVREWSEAALVLLAVVLLLNEARKAYLTDSPDTPAQEYEPPARLIVDRDLLDAVAEGDVNGETLAEVVEAVGEDLGEPEER
ncbi:hypothetical protein ACKVMT_09980 [Halobacteriales archaeon Cl-PHB]